MRRERVLNGLVDLLGPELEAAVADEALTELEDLLPAALEAPTCKSLRAKGPAFSRAKAAESSAQRSRRFPDRVVMDLVEERLYHKGYEIDPKAYYGGRLVEARR